MNVKFDPVKFRNWCAQNGTTFRRISESLGRYDGFIARCVRLGEFPLRQFELFQRLYNVEADAFAPDTTQAPISSAPLQTGPYSVSLDVKPDKVRVGINFQGAELYGAFAGIKGRSEVDLVQAISYAAHMCYKMAEQKKYSA